MSVRMEAAMARPNSSVRLASLAPISETCFSMSPEDVSLSRDGIAASVERRVVETAAKRRLTRFLQISPVSAGSPRPSGRSADNAPVQFLGEDMDLAGQLGVGFELEFLSFKVVVGLGLLEGRLAVLADHDEGRQEDRLK